MSSRIGLELLEVMSPKSDIRTITLEDSASPFWKREQERAIKDIVQIAQFNLNDHQDGPYIIKLDIENNKLALSIHGVDEAPLFSYLLSLSPYKKLIRDYFLLIESYETVRATGNLEKLEAIDMGRRGLHNDGAERLIERLSDKITMDHETARLFFTLICALYDKRFGHLVSFHR